MDLTETQPPDDVQDEVGTDELESTKLLHPDVLKCSFLDPSIGHFFTPFIFHKLNRPFPAEIEELALVRLQPCGHDTSW
ncbi:unnamed protein product [Urochloa humidicola]